MKFTSYSETDTRIDIKATSPQKIRIFVVEDEPIYVDALRSLIDEAPEEDMECVGFCHENTPNLPERIEATNADVVIVDLVLGIACRPDFFLKSEKINGIAAIQELRKQSRSELKIVGWDTHPTSVEQAVHAGADAYLLKGSSCDEIRNTIRYVHRDLCVPLREGLWIGEMTALEVFLATCEIVIIGKHDATPKLSLPRALIGLIYYLAKERHADAEHWLSMTEGSTQYKAQEQNLWYAICQRMGISALFDNAKLASWISKINSQVRPYIDKYGNRGNLILCPDMKHHARNKVSSYSLNERILSASVAIHDDTQT